MLKVETITAFVSVDKDGNEGIIAELMGDVWTPFVAADMKRLQSLIPLARLISLRSGKEIQVRQFAQYTDVTKKTFADLDQKTLKQYVVYDHPTDYPDDYVVREWHIIPGVKEAVPNAGFVLQSKKLDELRIKLFNMGLVKLARSEDDDPKIMEVWT